MRLRGALEEIAEKLGSHRDILFKHLKKQPELEKQILDFQAAIRAAIYSATPFDPATIVQNAKSQLDYDYHEFYGHFLERYKARIAEKKIVKNIRGRHSPENRLRIGVGEET